MTTNKELIEKYFDKTLTEKEKVLFKDKYDHELNFREELKQQAIIITSLKSVKIEHSEKEQNLITPIKTKKYWFPIATIAASIAVIFLIYFTFHQRLNNAETQIELLTIVNNENTELIEGYELQLLLLKDSLEQVAITKDSLEYKNVDSHAYNDMLYASLILMTNDDQKVKGANNTLTFLLPDRKQPLSSSSITIQWTPINSAGDIEVRYLDKGHNKKLDIGLSSSDYDLNSGHYVLKNLKRNTMYFFIIKTDIRDPYVFPFITK
jgi:hypothetical protein